MFDELEDAMLRESFMENQILDRIQELCAIRAEIENDPSGWYVAQLAKPELQYESHQARLDELDLDIEALRTELR